MKRTLHLCTVLVLSSILIVGAESFAAKSLYDDFSGIYIDSQKWNEREFVREVIAGKLVSKIGNASGMGEFRNSTRFQNPESITAIECELTVVATILDTGTEPTSFAGIGGFFYNTQVSGGATGDIWASLYIGDRGSGLEAYWLVAESLDDDLTDFEDKGSGTLIGPGTLTYGTPYTVKIEYDGDNGFTFTVAGASDSFTGPVRQRAAVTLFKAVRTGIDSYGGSGIGYGSALFDNVYINNEITAYDTFDSAPLDQTKWQNLEFVREISGGRLRLNVQADGSRTDATLRPSIQVTAYLEAKVLVESGSQVSSGASGIARIAGYYYNDSRGPGSGQPYDGNEGDAWVDNRITLDDTGNLRARCGIYRSDTPDPWGPGTTLFQQEFSTLIAFDTAYTLSIEFTGSQIIFKCNGETYQYDVATPMYPPSEGQHRQLRSRVYADPGESGYMKANFDDVYTGYTAEATYDATGTWVIAETDVENSCDPTVPPETFAATVTQTGNDVTMVDDEGETFTGTVSGSYYTLYGEILDQGEPMRLYVAFTLSSSTSGSGSYNWTWTDGVTWCDGGGKFTITKEPSCPDLYSWNGDEWENNGFIFARSHCPESESFQHRAVTHPVAAQGDTLTFKIKELDGEISYINSVGMYYKYTGDSANAWTELDLLSAIHNTAGDVSKALDEKDDERVDTVPGDEILLTYRLPSRDIEGATFKSVSSGYYLWSDLTYCQVLELGRGLEVRPGDTVILKAKINNMSTEELPDNAVVWFNVKGPDWSETKVASVSAAGLAPASPQWYSSDWSIPSNASAGTYSYDASIWIGETNITFGDYQECRLNVSSQSGGDSGASSPSAGGSSSGGGCFIASAAYGSALSNEVNVLKQFRDEYLLTRELGKIFVSAYYKYSPPLADYIAKHPVIRKIVRIGLYPIVGLSKWFVGENRSK